MDLLGKDTNDSLFWGGPHCGACRILVPPGMELVPPALGTQSLNHWATREIPRYFTLKKKKKKLFSYLYP